MPCPSPPRSTGAGWVSGPPCSATWLCRNRSVKGEVFQPGHKIPRSPLPRLPPEEKPWVRRNRGVWVFLGRRGKHQNEPGDAAGCEPPALPGCCGWPPSQLPDWEPGPAPAQMPFAGRAAAPGAVTLPSSLCPAPSHGSGSSSWVAASEKAALIPMLLQSPGLALGKGCLSPGLPSRWWGREGRREAALEGAGA